MKSFLIILLFFVSHLTLAQSERENFLFSCDLFRRCGEYDVFLNERSATDREINVYYSHSHRGYNAGSHDVGTYRIIFELEDFYFLEPVKFSSTPFGSTDDYRHDYAYPYTNQWIYKVYKKTFGCGDLQNILIDRTRLPKNQ